MSTSRQAWFHESIRFECQRGCVRCCTGEPGDVFLTRAELHAIAATQQMSVAEFEDRFVRHYSSGSISLKERPNGDCVMLGSGGCTVYEARPQQCRDYPFWPEIMESARTWLRESRRCPGINTGEVQDTVSIVEILKRQNISSKST